MVQISEVMQLGCKLGREVLVSVVSMNSDWPGSVVSMNSDWPGSVVSMNSDWLRLTHSGPSSEGTVG